MAPTKVTGQASVGVPLGWGEWVLPSGPDLYTCLWRGLGALRDKRGEERGRSGLGREMRNRAESLVVAASLSGCIHL